MVKNDKHNMMKNLVSLKTRLLFVDEDQNIRHCFCENLHDENLLIQTVPHNRDILQALKNFAANIIILDIGEGPILLNKIQSRFPDVFILAIISSNTPADAAMAKSLGIYDHIFKPFDFVAIRELIQTINDHRTALEKASFPETERRKRYRFDNLIGRDPKMFAIYTKIDDIAATSSTVLITGETGTGKERVAEAIHFRSPRKSGPLIRVNCASFTETLVNSELFGHEKGAFTGAMALKKGCFELADKGTIFLDEIGNISIQTQVSLLRVLESRTFQRVGGVKSLKFDGRIICATNMDLWHEVKEHRFREDLFYRINVVPIHLPPLREKIFDIPILATYFLKIYCKQNGKKISRISRPGMNMLVRYNWPGNIRELANAIEQAVVFCKKNEITPDDLPRRVCEASHPGSFTFTLTSPSLPKAESALIQRILEETNWNLKQAAGMLDIARGTVYSKMRKYKIEKPHSAD